MDTNEDMRFGHGLADFYLDEPNAVAQSILTRLRFWRGEWFLDSDEGTPWTDDALGVRTRDTILPMIRRRILQTTGVQSIGALAVTIEPETRAATVSATVQTIYGQVALREVL